MSAQEYHDSNFLIVAAVEEYAFRHHMKTEDVIYKFKRHNIFSAIRSQYKVVHMLDLGEASLFVEDMLRKVST